MPTPPTPPCGRCLTPLGEKTLATMPVPLDHLAAHLDPGYECLEGGQRHRATRYRLAPPPERLVQVQFGGVMPCILTSSPAKLFAEDLP